MPSKSKPKRSFGQIARLPSRRYRARYTGPDTALHNAPHTFEARIDAEAWLTDERRLIVGETWSPPRDREAKLRGPLTFRSYSASWLADRNLKPRTREHYGYLLRYQLAALDDVPLKQITPVMVRRWHSSLRPPQVGLSIVFRFMPRRAGRSVGGGLRGWSLGLR